jgi:putative transferase (TIGR04331 family)
MDAIVAAPYGTGQTVRDRDYVFARKVEEELSVVLAAELNRMHGTTYSLRFWSILLGHWLRRYVDVLYNRFHTLEQCVERHEICSTTALASDNYHLATATSLAFIWACNDDTWNNVLGARVLQHVSAVGMPVDLISVDDGSGFRLPENQRDDSAGRRLRDHLLDAMDTVTNLFVRDDDAFIINSYLPNVHEAKVQLLLGQIPKIWRAPKPNFPAVPDRVLRNELTQRLSSRNTAGFLGCVDALLFELLPICYLEDLSALRTLTEKLPWPKRPHFVFTSNNFDTDEAFKYWTAAQVDDGVPLYIGQHGNNYGTHRYVNPSVEEQVSDRFLTWGWTDGLPQHTAAFIFKTAGTKSPVCQPSGGLLLIGVSVNHRITAWDEYADFAVYFDDQLKFVSNLVPRSRHALTIRLHSAYRRMGWSEEMRWLDFDSSLRIDSGVRPIRSAIAESRLVVHSYDSTGILEGLAQNVPTLAFWQNGLEHLRESARPWYQLLIDAGVVHLSPESAARQVNDVWDDVLGWWHSDQVQNARRQFCDRYAVTSDRPARDFMRIVKESGTRPATISATP